MWRHPLVAGFGGLLLMMAAAEAGALLMINSMRTNDAQVAQRFLERSRTLEDIRSSIYLSGTVARDSLLAPAGSAPAQWSEVKALERRTKAALDNYQKSTETDERAALASLRNEIEAYWKVLNQTFSWSAEEREKYRYQFFYSELMPRRTAMLQIADRVGQMNEQGLQRGDQQLAGLFERLRLGLIGMVLLTLTGGSALAVFTSRTVLRLQKEVRTRLEESIETKTSLRELSVKLVRAQEEERRVISRELHDEAGQSFSAILLETENLLDIEGFGLKQGGSVRAHLESIRNLAQHGLAGARNLALLLRPSMLDDFGLVPALNWQAKETAKRTGLRIQVLAQDLPRDLPEEHKTCIYRVVQEALTNVSRHAQASAAQVVVRQIVRQLDRQIELTVQDDGSGFDAERARGLGLLGMEERAHHLGGTLAIDSQPGRGTLLTINLPLAKLASDLTHETDTDFASRRP